MSKSQSLKNFFFEHDIAMRNADSVDKIIEWNFDDNDDKESNINDLKKRGDEIVNRSFEFLTSNDWAVEKVANDGDEVSYLKLPKPVGKIFKITGIVDAPAEVLIDRLFKNVVNTPQWEKQVAESKKLFAIDQNTDVVYQASHRLGTVYPRDFVTLRHRGKRGSYFILAGISVSSKLTPERRNYVRGENGVNCWATEALPNNQCRFTWIMDVNLKGWIPPKILELTTSSLMLNFMKSLRNHVQIDNHAKQPF